MPDKIISYSFYLLFFLTPLFWTSLNYELFEYNKMILTYAFTVIIAGVWLLKTINDKRLTINRTPLDIPLLLFLGANILSTIFSIDPHTSVWGYYSRSNGGLLSIVSYLLLYFAFVSNMDLPKVKTTLKWGLAAGLLISLWAILEHFGVSFSCVMLRGELNDACWIQDVQARVFASLGQPNWLAAYLSMLIFPAMYFLLTAKNKLSIINYQLSIIVIYLAFTFTYSRGPTLGLIGGMAVFLVLYFFQNTRKTQQAGESDDQKIRILKHWYTDTLILRVILSFLIINLLFGSALTSFRLVSKFAAPARPSIGLPAPSSSSTQLENGGTESGQIRFIVWKGALDIFKHYPILGSGLETFAYSYYQYRPASHNLTSEWDFLYNKAHNEYLNYLATTGIVGFGSYIIVIITFIVWSLKIQNSEFRVQNKVQNLKSKILNSKFNSEFYILNSTLLASYISYLIYNFFLFSVVIIAIFFYLFPALVFVATRSFVANAPQDDNLRLGILRKLSTFLYRRPLYTQAAKGLVIFSIIYLLFSIFQLWYADTLFAKGQTALEAGNPGKAYNLLALASELNKAEPFYRSELSFAAAQAATSLKDSDATLSAALKDEAISQTDEVLKVSPGNISFMRSAVRTYFELSALDKNYIDKTLQTLDLAIKFAPTDPKLYYNKALILDTLGKKDEEIKVLQQALQLKPNYLEALVQLKEATESAKGQ